MSTRISKRKLVIAAVAAFLGLSSLALYAAVPVTPFVPVQIPYQGYLQKNGIAVSGPTSMTFVITDPGPPLKTVCTNAITTNVAAGRFSVVLGGGSTAGTTIDPGYLDGSVGSGKPLQVQVTLGTETLGPQQLFAAPYAFAAQSASASPGDFAAHGALTTTKGASIGADLNVSGNLSAGGAAQSASLSITGGAGTINGAGAAPNRALTLNENVHVTGNLTVSGNTLTTRLTPDYDSKWFYVVDSGGLQQLAHGLGTPPSQVTLLECGKLNGAPNPNPPTIGQPFSGGCSSRTVQANMGGFHAAGGDINPMSVSSDDSYIYVDMAGGWYVWSYYSSGAGWSCAGDADNNCWTGYYRVLAWR